MWDVYAASYDRVIAETSFYQEALERHRRHLDSKAIKRVLDIGAGTGVLTLQVLHAGKSVTALDPSYAMLARLRSKVSPKYYDMLDDVQESAEWMPFFADEEFDAVNVLLAFFDMANPFAALDEAVRVLKPSGLLVITEPRISFDVKKLEESAREALQSKGLFDDLASDWPRVLSVAPLIEEKIQRNSLGRTGRAGRLEWNAEYIRNFLSKGDFSETTFENSHMGNCATITAHKAS